MTLLPRTTPARRRNDGNGDLAAIALALLVILAVSAYGATADAGPLDTIYDDDDLVDLAPLYERGWKDNYENVVRPTLSAEERARLDQVRFVMRLRIPDHEPFGFLAGRGMVVASAASIRFIEDLSMAYTWLESNGYSTQSMADYLLMLRYWNPDRGNPPRPWDVLCIPHDAFEDANIAGRARRAFNTAVVFVLLHEYGHLLYQHPGNRTVPPDVSRVNEQQADRFALDRLVGIGDMPTGVPILFFVMAHLMENRADFDNDAEYRATLAARTHPVSPDRLQALARHMSEMAGAYEGNVRPGARLSALGLGLQISQLAHLMADGGVQWLSSRIGRTVTPDDLGPRLPGRHLAPPCDAEARSDRPFEGLFHGEITSGQTALGIDALLHRDGDHVRGSYSYGAGFGRFSGQLDGDSLSYGWTLPPDTGRARLTRQRDAYRGTWGIGDSESGGGTIELAR